EFLRSRPGGRVLAPWWLGHTIDVIGGHGVVIDNFGNMPDRSAFERANEALLWRDERAMARYCQANGIRFVVLTNPILGVRDAAAVIGWRTSPGAAAWWWRTWFSRRAQQFSLVYDNWRPEWQGAWMAHSPAIEIWELHAPYPAPRATVLHVDIVYRSTETSFTPRSRRCSEMPWSRGAVDERKRLIGLWEAGYSPTELARRFGVSRPTVYEVIGRWMAEGELGL